MTTQPSDPAMNVTGAARYALVTGLISIVLVGIYLFTAVGSTVLYGSMLAGLAGVVLGVVALRKQQHKGVAITGLITGLVGFLLGLGIVLFALAFVGVFSA